MRIQKKFHPTAKKYLTSDQIEKIQTDLTYIPKENETIKTDSNGEFKIGGLDPDKKYTIKFRYNGMRYSEIVASIDVEGCGTPTSIKNTTTAKAVENEEQRAALTAKFSEIGPYPNNYYDENGQGHLVFTQTEVENYLKGNGEVNVNEAEMQKFIEESMIEAEIPEKIGGILGECEDAIRQYNSQLDSRLYGNYVFPVVEEEARSKYYLQ